MKLLQCRKCGDIVRIYSVPRGCHCGACSAHYVSDTRVKIDGPGRALGIDTRAALFEREGTWHESDKVVRP